MSGDLIKKPPSSLSLPEVSNAESVSLNAEVSLIKGVLDRLINGGGSQTRACRDLLELSNQFTRAMHRMPFCISRNQMKLLVDQFLELLDVDLDLSPLRQQLHDKIDQLRNNADVSNKN